MKSYRLDRYLWARRPRRHAFTLVEVLVVIAIITTLIAILVPALSASRRSARRTECQANLRHLAIAWTDYLDQYSEHFYQRVNANLIYGGIQGKGSAAYGADPATPVARPLNPHLGLPEIVSEGAEVFRCPSDNGSRTAAPTCFAYYGTSYLTNLMLIGQDQLPINPADPCKSVLQKINRRLKGLTRSKVSTNPAQIILVGDFGWVSAWNRYDPNKVEWHDKSKFHNLAYLDGHADFVRIRKGLHVTDEYAVVPFADLASLAAGCQKEVP